MGVGFFHDYMGILRRTEKRYDDALLYFGNSLRIRESLQSNYNINETKISLASLLNDINRNKEAIPHLQHAIDNQGKEQSLSQQRFAYEGLAVAYGAIGNYKNAYDNHLQFKIVSDSILNKDKLETILEKDAKYERVEKDKEIVELQLSDEIKSNR
jgi:tetratricopeptide (TPR) repeat protein